MATSEKKTISDRFWKEWIKAGELEREELVRTLPVLSGASRHNLMIISSTLLNSYLVDFYNYLKKEKKKHD